MRGPRNYNGLLRALLFTQVQIDKAKGKTFKTKDDYKTSLKTVLNELRAHNERVRK